MPVLSKNSANKFFFFVLVILLAWYLGRFFPVEIPALQDYFRKFPFIFSGPIFIFLYVVVTFFIWMSKDLFWLAGAAAFGAFRSASLIWIAEIINAAILFHLARWFGRAYVEEKTKGKYVSLDKRIGDLSLGWLFIFRAAPLIPFRFLDLAAGLTKLNFKKYLTAVILGSALKIFWLQYIIVALGESIFRNPNALVEYFLKNKIVFAFSLIYVILVFVTAMKLKKK
ncbi:MAG: VTT domain-containing protein [Candidatus Omnitrophota bacterium]